MTGSGSGRASWLSIGLAVIVLVAACGPGTPSSEAGTTVPLGSIEPSPVASGAAASAGAADGQTDTDWGRIWDLVPEEFPVYPGAAPADDAATEVASATFAVDGADPRTVVGWMQAELERGTFATEALNGPLEDGSFVLESTGSAGCRIEIAVAPLGGLTTIRVRYGAACPAP